MINGETVDRVHRAYIVPSPAGIERDRVVVGQVLGMLQAWRSLRGRIDPPGDAGDRS